MDNHTYYITKTNDWNKSGKTHLFTFMMTNIVEAVKVSNALRNEGYKVAMKRSAYCGVEFQQITVERKK